MIANPRPRIARSAITGLILAGGQGSRMGGVDKGLEPLQGRPLVEHAIARLAPQVGALMISANRNTDRYAQYGFPIVGDGNGLAPGLTSGHTSGVTRLTIPGQSYPASASERTSVAEPPPRPGSAPFSATPPASASPSATASPPPTETPTDALPVTFNGPLAGIASGLASIDSEWMLVVPCDAPLFPEDLAQRLAEAIEISTADLAFATTIEPDGTRLTHPVFALIPRRLASSAAHELALGSRKLGAWYVRHNAVQVSFRDSRAFYNANTLHDLRELER